MADTAAKPPVSSDTPKPSPFLYDAAPRWAASGLAYMVIALVLGAAVAAVVIRLPEIVSSEFVLVPAHGVDPVRASRAGRVTEVRVVEGTAVRGGETLFVIRSGAVVDQSAELLALETQSRGADAAATNARERYDGQRRADLEQMRGLGERQARLVDRMENHRALGKSREARYQTSVRMAESEVSSVGAEIEFKREHLTLAREIAARYKRGYEANFLSWSEYTRAGIEASRTGVELGQLQRQLEVSQLRLGQLRAERDAEETEWRVAMAQLESEGEEIRVNLERLRHESAARDAEYRETSRRLKEEAARTGIRLSAVRDTLAEAQGNRLPVAAPCAGSMVRLAVKRHDAVVQEGEVLGEVACSGERLQAELTVPPTGIGKIKSGQGVKLKYEAFPYERYGVRYAKLDWVSAVSVQGKSGTAAFRALAAIDEEAVKIDGQLRPLLAGMGGRADVVVGRRPLISYVFEPLRQLTENMAGGSGK